MQPYQHPQQQPQQQQQQPQVHHQQIQSQQQSVMQQKHIPSQTINTSHQTQPQVRALHLNQSQKTTALQTPHNAQPIPQQSQQQQKQQQPSLLQQNHQAVINNIERRLGGANVLPIQNQSHQKMAPRNNEYLEKQQQNKNLDLRGPSPAQATDTTEAHQTPSNIRSTRNNVAAAVTPKNSIPENQKSPSQVPQITPHNNQQPQQANALGATQNSNAVNDLNAAPKATLIPSNVIDVKSTNSSTPTSTNPVSSTSHTQSYLQRPVRIKENPIESLPVSKIEDLNWNALVINLNVIPKKDLDLLQDNIDLFAEKSPAMAKKLGVIPDEDAIFAKIKSESEYYFLSELSLYE